MPYIDETLINPLIAGFLALLWVSYCGAVLVRYACGIRDWTLLPPLGLAAGCALFLFCANLLGYFGSVPVAFGGAIALLSSLGIYATIRLWPSNWQLPSRRFLLAISGYILLALMLVYGCLAVRNHAYFYDFPSHLAFAATIARDNLPVRNPYSPVLPSAYHYGAALLVGALARATTLPPVIGYQLLAALQGAALLLLAFALGRQAGKHALWGLVCLCATLAMGSLVLAWPFVPSPTALTALLRGEFATDQGLHFPGLREYIESVYPIVSFSTDLRWLLIYPHRLAGFLTVVALAIMLAGPGKRSRDHRSLALAIGVAAAVGLYDETMLPLALMALAWPLLFLRREKRRALMWLGGLLAAVAIAVLQGGSVTHALLAGGDAGPLLTLRGPVEAARSLVLAKALPEGWLWLLPPLPLAASAMVFAWKRWWLGVLLCAFGFAGLVGFYAFEYHGVTGSGEFSRVVNLSFLTLALTAPLAVARLLRDAPSSRTLICGALLLPVAVSTLAQPLASIASDLRLRVELYHPTTSELVYTPQITDPWVTRRLHENRDVYRQIAEILSKDGVVLTEHPVSFAIATGIPVAYGSIEGLSVFPSHIYFPGPAFYDAFWRLDPAAWRAFGATAVLYHQRTYDSLPLPARAILEGDGWFVRQLELGEYLFFTPTQAFLQYGAAPTNSFTSLATTIPAADTVFLSNRLPLTVGQALVRLLRHHPTTGLGPNASANQWIRVNRPAALSASEATWHVYDDVEARELGFAPEAALWRWRSPSESVGVYPNATIPLAPPTRLVSGESMRLLADVHTLAWDDGHSLSSTARFASLSLVMAGQPGSVVRLCTAAACGNRDLGGNVWLFSLPLGEELSQFTATVVHGEVYAAATLGFGEPHSGVRAPGVVLRARQNGNAIEADAAYFNQAGWPHGDGIAWQLAKVLDGSDQDAGWWASQLLIDGDRGDVRLTLDPDGKISEDNFSSPAQSQAIDPLSNGDYMLYLTFTSEPFGIVDRVPAARFTLHEGAIVSFSALTQIARLSFGTEISEPLMLIQ